jgi:hypothetical protein
VLEELEPIDENRRYDFNYQQFAYLNKEVQVLPVSTFSIVVSGLLHFNTAYFRATPSN